MQKLTLNVCFQEREADALEPADDERRCPVDNWLQRRDIQVNDSLSISAEAISGIFYFKWCLIYGLNNNCIAWCVDKGTEVNFSKQLFDRSSGSLLKYWVRAVDILCILPKVFHPLWSVCVMCLVIFAFCLLQWTQKCDFEKSLELDCINLGYKRHRYWSCCKEDCIRIFIRQKKRLAKGESNLRNKHWLNTRFMFTRVLKDFLMIENAQIVILA